MGMTLSTARRVLIPRRIARRTLSGAGVGFPVIQLGSETMGTFWSASLVLPAGIPAEGAERALLGVFERVIRQMSPWRLDSELVRFNEAEPGSWHALSPEFFEVLQTALRVAGETEGAYTPAIGKAIDLLGFGPSTPSEGHLDRAAFAAAMRTGQWSRIEMDPVSSRALQPGGIHLDLGSIAKGFAVDLAAREIMALGCENFLIEIGGEIRAHGCKPDAQPWWCRLERFPAVYGESIETVLALCDCSLAGSGNGRRRRFIDGRWHGHIVNGLNGGMPSPALETVFVLHPQCMMADAYATALFAMGRERGFRFAEEREIAALFVLAEPGAGSERWTSAWRALID